MFRSISIALAIAGVLVVGALTAVAANAHGSPVSRLATTTALKAAAKGNAISTLASARGEQKSDAVRAGEATDATTDDAAQTDRDTHGDAVSAVAKSDATAAHEHGAKKVNHGGAVSEDWLAG